VVALLVVCAAALWYCPDSFVSAAAAVTDAAAGLGLACCVTAGLLPYVTDLMAFVGALLTMSVSLILPALMHLVLFRQEAGPWLLALDVAVVLLGVCCAFVGASSAAGSLQQKLAAAAC
jgi:hypothetical protein